MWCPHCFPCREAQRRREAIMEKLVDARRAQEDSEEQRVSAAVAQRDAREAQLQWEEEERRAALLQSIAEHRELTVTPSVVDGAPSAVLHINSKISNIQMPLPEKVKNKTLKVCHPPPPKKKHLAETQPNSHSSKTLLRHHIITMQNSSIWSSWCSVFYAWRMASRGPLWLHKGMI